MKELNCLFRSGTHGLNKQLEVGKDNWKCASVVHALLQCSAYRSSIAI